MSDSVSRLESLLLIASPEKDALEQGQTHPRPIPHLAHSDQSLDERCGLAFYARATKSDGQT